MPVTFLKQSHRVQTLPTGDDYSIQSYHFSGGPGPSIYIQANLHGPEIIGTPLVGLLIRYLQSLEDIQGSITLVPCANPMGVNDASLALDGRWNKKSGLNWNRIHHVNEQWLSREDKHSYYVKKLETQGISIEERLSTVLHLIAGQPDYVIDLHAAGLHSCDYRFVYPNVVDDFALLGNELSIVVDSENCITGDFMGSFVRPFMDTPELMAKVCTWELAGDQQVYRDVLDARWISLKRWVDNLLLGVPSENPGDTIEASLSQFEVIHSQRHGYYIWEKDVGERVKAGEAYLTYYDPVTNCFQSYSESKDFLLVSKYTIGAVGEGEQIGERVWL